MLLFRLFSAKFSAARDSDALIDAFRLSVYWSYHMMIIPLGRELFPFFGQRQEGTPSVLPVGWVCWKKNDFAEATVKIASAIPYFQNGGF